MAKTVAFTFMRANPPTIGHLKLIETLSKQPADDHFVYLSHSQDKKKNPLSYDKKLFYAREFFEKAVPTVQVIESDSRTAVQVLGELNGKYSSIIFVAGGDRIEDFDRLLNAYNGVPTKTGDILYQFDFIDVVSAGERDPEAEDVTGMSASKLRALAQENNFEEFKKGVPSDDEELIQQLFNDVRSNSAHIRESALDPIQKTRNREIFGPGDDLQGSVRDFIVDTFEEWKDNYDTDFDIKNIYFIGSSAGFQYTTTSDIDINVETTLTQEEKKQALKLLPNGNMLPGTTHPVNYFLFADDEEFEKNNSIDIYDVLNDEWVKKSDQDDLEVPFQYLADMSSFFMNAIDLAISDYKRDALEFEQVTKLNIDDVVTDAHDKEEQVNRIRMNLMSDLDALKMARHVVRSFLHEAYEDEPFSIQIEYSAEGASPQKSVNALIYKMLERYGYRYTLDNTIKEIEELLK